MHILFAGQSLAEPLGGGELSARVLLEHLAATHDVEAVCVGSTDRDYLINNTVRCHDHALRRRRTPAAVPFHLAGMVVETQFRPVLARRVRQRPPDLLILQSPAHLHATDVPESCRLVVFIRSLACYGVGEANPSRWRQVAGWPFRLARLRRNRAMLDRADCVVTNSRFLQAALLTCAGIPSHVVTPFIETGALTSSLKGGPADCLTFVGVDEWKGGSLALRLAEALPERRFLFLAGARPSAELLLRAGRLDNVTCLNWTTDMAGVFDRTRLVLMPSLWEEPFGRLPVEAGACGIPTIASARGGLPESVGTGGILIDPTDDLDHWVEQIRALDDRSRYAALSAAARSHAATHSAAVTLRRFAELVHSELGLP